MIPKYSPWDPDLYIIILFFLVLLVLHQVLATAGWLTYDASTQLLTTEWVFVSYFGYGYYRYHTLFYSADIYFLVNFSALTIGLVYCII